MPLKLKFPGGDGKRTKNSAAKASSNNFTDRHYPPPKSQRHHSANVESVTETPSDEEYSPVFSDSGRSNNNVSPLGSPQSAPESWACSPPHLEQRRRPKSVSAPPQPEEAAAMRSKESKPGRNRAFSVSRSGKFKEAKRRTSLLEIQDRFDKASKGPAGERGGSDSNEKS